MNLITGYKTPEQLADMRECGKMLATIYDELRARVVPGMSELDADAYVAGRINDFGAEATYLTDEVRFPGVICVSTNEQLVHSPATDYVFEVGDVVSFDLVISYLELFHQLRIINTIHVGWKLHYELAEPFVPHHHHLYCTRCKNAIPLQTPELEQLINYIGHRYHFQVQQHHFEA